MNVENLSKSVTSGDRVVGMVLFPRQSRHPNIIDKIKTASLVIFAAKFLSVELFQAGKTIVSELHALWKFFHALPW